MKKHIPYFDFYPADFMNGVRGLSAQEVGIYTMILCRVYEESGPIEFHISRLAAYCGMRPTSFQKAVERLIDLGKLTLADGLLGCPVLGAWGANAKRAEYRVAIPAEIKRDVVAEGDCAYCGSNTGPFEIDHIHPWSRGGTNERHNLALACRPCNRSKSNLTIGEWLQ